LRVARVPPEKASDTKSAPSLLLKRIPSPSLISPEEKLVKALAMKSPSGSAKVKMLSETVSLPMTLLDGQK
jgi:hypothetical protein